MTAPVNNAFGDAWQMLDYYLRQWGLSSLGGAARQMLTNGDSADVVTLKLADTKEYKDRFAGNAARISKGLRALSPAEYVENERQYQDVMRQNGLPTGFYDSLDDFKKFIEDDVSPQELTDRAKSAQANYIGAPQEMKDQLQRFMQTTGVQPNQILASMLDPDKAWPDLQRTINASSIAAEAQRAFQDQTHLGVDRAMQLATQGVTSDQARSAFGELAGRQQRDTFLTNLTGQDLSQAEQENELLVGDQAAKAKRLAGQQAEQARFKGNYLGTDQRSGFGLTGVGGGSY